MISKRIGVQFGSHVTDAVPAMGDGPAVVQLHMSANDDASWPLFVASHVHSTLVGRVVDHPLATGPLNSVTGKQYAEQVILPLAARCEGTVKWWIGSNERAGGGSTRNERISGLSALNDFESAFAERIQAEGYHGLVGGLSTGNPNIVDSNNALDMSEWQVFYPAMRIAHGFHWHEYWNPHLLQDRWTAYRYTKWYPLLPDDLKLKPSLISELGVDGGLAGDGRSGWQTPKYGISPDMYLRMLGLYDAELSAYPMIAATLFIVGGYGWDSFDVRSLLHDLSRQQGFSPNYIWGNIHNVVLPPVNPPPVITTDPADLARISARKLTWISINTDSAFYKYATAHALGSPLTDEYPFTVGSDDYLGQVYQFAIVYAKKGDWDSIQQTTLSKLLQIHYPFSGTYPVTQNFGANPDAYSKFNYDGVPLKGHNGIDFGLPMHTPVAACDAGIVIETAYDPTGYGNYVKLRHTWGESIYGHLDGLILRLGSSVGSGDLVGHSNNTGNSTGPHLHFGVRIDPYVRRDGWGGYSDPAPYLVV